MKVNGYKIEPKAYLRGADLRSADLRSADLRDADLQGAYLQWADLQGADLRDANLRGADLRDANLRGADLRDANLRGADLQGANLRGADLQDTCLDPSNVPNQQGTEQFKDNVGYRTKRQMFLGYSDYEVGKTYTAPWFSTAETECHPGLYIYPTLGAAIRFASGGHYYQGDYIKVTFDPVDLHQAGDKWRVKSFTVVEEIKGVGKNEN
jgi:hypothetical protein